MKITIKIEVEKDGDIESETIEMDLPPWTYAHRVREAIANIILGMDCDIFNQKKPGSNS